MTIIPITNAAQLPRQYAYVGYCGTAEDCVREHNKRRPWYPIETAYYVAPHLYVPMEWRSEAKEHATQ